MVSTRRTVREEPAPEQGVEPDLSLTIRKKPVRRAPVKKPEPEIAPEPKTRATRGRRAAVVSDGPEETATTVATRVSRTRDQQPTRATSRANKDAPAATRGTAASRKGKAESTQPEPVPYFPQPEDAKSKKRTRINAAAAQPLSTMNAIHVSRAAADNVRAETQRPAIKKTSRAQSVKAAKKANQKRSVSDENNEMAVVPQTHGDAEDSDEIVVAVNPPIKSTLRRRAQKESALESEASMSSTPTTPCSSTTPNFETPPDDSLQAGSDNHSDQAADTDQSEDELCGPKTPLKRQSPKTEARHLASIRRTVRRANEGRAEQTHVGRSSPRNNMYSTPSTHHSNRRPNVLSSAVRSVSGARAAEAPYRLRNMTRPDAPQESNLSDMLPMLDSDTVILDEMHDEAPSNDIRSCSPEVPGSREREDKKRMTTSASFNDQADPDETIVIDEADEPTDAAGAPVVAYFNNPADPNETIVIDDADEPADTFHAPAASFVDFDVDDTVIINYSEGYADRNDDSGLSSDCDVDESFRCTTASPTPETMIWENIRQDVTIQVDFNPLLAGARTLPQPDATERLRISTDTLLSGGDETIQKAELEYDHIGRRGPSESRSALVNDVEYTTIDLNDFVNLAALSEPIKLIDLVEIVNVEEVTSRASIDSGESRMREAERVPEGEDVTVAAATEISRPSNAEFDIDDRVIRAPTATVAECKSPTVWGTPHYALPTAAYDARRKSLPAIYDLTPVRAGTRPHTSDGSSMPRVVNSFSSAWWARANENSTTTTPIRARSNTMQHAASTKKMTIQDKPKDTSTHTSTPVAKQTERFPKLPARRTHHDYADTVAAPNRFYTPVKVTAKRPATETKLARNALTSRTSLQSKITPKTSSTQTPNLDKPEAEELALRTPVSVQATPSNRFPRLPPRKDYEEHAKTVAAPSRFRTPNLTPAKQPATTQKPASLRKLALAANTSASLRTPVKTPLKPATTTPGLAPMTPHPAAPLKGVVAMVEIFTMEGASASAPFTALLHRLGARTTKIWSDRVTHVVFKDGSPTTLQRVRLHNKEVEAEGKRALIHCVNSRWVSNCESEGKRIDETDHAYAVDLAEIPRGGKRRRKSMEPAALRKIGANVVRDPKESVGRSSFGRSPRQIDSPAKPTSVLLQATPVSKVNVAVLDKENGGDFSGSPATPAWLHPEQLVQQTAPMNRVRKLDLKSMAEAKNRRLTFWNQAG